MPAAGLQVEVSVGVLSLFLALTITCQRGVTRERRGSPRRRGRRRRHTHDSGASPRAAQDALVLVWQRHRIARGALLRGELNLPIQCTRRDACQGSSIRRGPRAAGAAARTIGAGPGRAPAASGASSVHDSAPLPESPTRCRVHFSRTPCNAHPSRGGSDDTGGGGGGAHRAAVKDRGLSLHRPHRATGLGPHRPLHAHDSRRKHLPLREHTQATPHTPGRATGRPPMTV